MISIFIISTFDYDVKNPFLNIKSATYPPELRRYRLNRQQASLNWLRKLFSYTLSIVIFAHFSDKEAEIDEIYETYKRSELARNSTASKLKEFINQFKTHKLAAGYTKSDVMRIFKDDWNPPKSYYRVMFRHNILQPRYSSANWYRNGMKTSTQIN